MPARQIEAILLHELAHIRRLDYPVNLLQTVVEGFLFYHPAIWWISRVIRTEREHCCDDLAVAATGDAREYAAALSALAQSRWAASETALAANGGNLMKRVRRLLYPLETPHTGFSPALGAAVLTITAALALTAWQTASENKPPERNPYQLWLTEDVAYIITNMERKAFKALQTDPEREHFIEQFWLRRDPTPGTVENEAKEEHYRRVAYANTHFWDLQHAGWKTDRGRIYIVHGAPDEIESHSGASAYKRPASERSGVVNVHASEEWRYAHIEGIGDDVIMEFVDRDGNGEYHMTLDPAENTRP
jgi:GWxTD domain-containing protein